MSVRERNTGEPREPSCLSGISFPVSTSSPRSKDDGVFDGTLRLVSGCVPLGIGTACAARPSFLNAGQPSVVNFLISTK